MGKIDKDYFNIPFDNPTPEQFILWKSLVKHVRPVSVEEFVYMGDVNDSGIENDANHNICFWALDLVLCQNSMIAPDNEGLFVFYTDLFPSLILYNHNYIDVEGTPNITQNPVQIKNIWFDFFTHGSINTFAKFVGYKIIRGIPTVGVPTPL